MSSEQISTPIRAGIFAKLSEADNAVEKLLAADFTKEEVTVVAAEEHIQKHFEELDPLPPEPTASMESGILVGSGIGLGLGALTAAGFVAAGGLGIVAAGAMLGMGITGTLIGAFTSRGVEKEVADFYDQGIRQGHILVSVEVHGDDAAERLTQAEQIFHEAGARPIELTEG